MRSKEANNSVGLLAREENAGVFKAMAVTS